MHFIQSNKFTICENLLSLSEKVKKENNFWEKRENPFSLLRQRELQQLTLTVVQ